MSDMQALKNAFDALNKQGVMTRHNYWCCGGCAGGALAQEYEQSRFKKVIIGGVYYHEQSAEHALDGRGLTLYYDALPSAGWGTEQQKAVGELIVAALLGNGLTVEWDGDPMKAIELPRFNVTLDEIPEGTESSLHATHGTDPDYDDYDEDGYY